MRLVLATLSRPAANLALDEALLEMAEAGDGPSELLRLWTAETPMVVLGRSSKIDVEVDRPACRREGVPILRRTSGGAAIVTGPGCLMYAVVLSCRRRPELRRIDRAHDFVLSRIAASIGRCLPGVAHRGVSDLAWGERKISGNSMRMRRDHLLYHGTLLFDFPLEMIGRLLGAAPRQPDYRCGRDHLDFVANAPLTEARLRDCLIEAFAADRPFDETPEQFVDQLIREKYDQDEWTHRF